MPPEFTTPVPDVKFDAARLAEQAVLAVAERAAVLAAERAAGEAAERAATRTADMVIEKLFLHLGIDVNDKAGLNTLRENLQFLARMDRGAREIKSIIVKTCVGAVVMGMLAILAIGIRDWFLK